MNMENFTPDELVKLTSWRPPNMIDSSVVTHNATFVPKKPSSSDLGLLELFPSELLDLILGLLDVRSLLRFTRTCHWGNATVDALPEYRVLIEHAYKALVALEHVDQIATHSIASLHATLLRDDCLICHQFAPFLYFATAERYCFKCLNRDRTLRAINREMAHNCFGVNLEDLGQIPSIINYPHAYFAPDFENNPSARLYAVKHLEALGIRKHGSPEAMHSFITSQNSGNLTIAEAEEVEWLSGRLVLTGSRTNMVPVYPLSGVAFTEYNVLRPNGVLERGHWCLGCRQNSGNFARSRVADEETILLAAGQEPQFYLAGMTSLARSREGFLDHVKVCTGVKYLPALQEGPDGQKYRDLLLGQADAV